MRITRWQVVASNFVLAVIFYATAQVHPPMLAGLTLAGLSALVPVVIAIAEVRRAQRDIGIVLGLVGTALFWTPIWATAYEYVGPFPDTISTVTDVSIWTGVALFLASALWPVTSHA